MRILTAALRTVIRLEEEIQQLRLQLEFLQGQDHDEPLDDTTDNQYRSSRKAKKDKRDNTKTRISNENLGAHQEDEDPFQPMDVVEITARGPYKGRKATILSRRGNYFWNLKVHRRRCDITSPCIYRKFNGLCLLRRPEESTKSKSH